ncbi:hypothetical protein [Cupriavidus oxalaticus]|uniref:hypothetical protein n=1 Tax=Cupriavidus oxalaticus TaxID=96344 RepID=UPI0012471107|nr:hypothetical protein [Cupriavidus oxalaticus]
MSDDSSKDSPTAQPEYAVSAREFSNFLARKNPHGFKCTVCGSSSWVPSSFSVDEKPAMMLPVYSPFSRSEIFTKPPEYIDNSLEKIINSFFTLTCQTCHNSLFFSAIRVAIDIQEADKLASQDKGGSNG